MPCSVTPGGLAPPAAISCEPSFGTGVLATERARGASGSTGLAAGAGAGGVGVGASEGASDVVVVGGFGRAGGVLAFGAPVTLMAGEGDDAEAAGAPKENEGFDAGAPNDPAVGAGDGVTLAGAAEKLGTARGGAESGELERGAVEVKLRKPPGDLLVVGEGTGGVAGVRLDAVCCAEGEGAKLKDGGFGASAGGGAKLKLGALTDSGALVASGSLPGVGCDGVGDGGAGLRRESKDG